MPQSVKTIGTYAFNGNHLTTLKLNEGLVNIDASAFSFNDLTHVDFPSTLKTIGNSAFALNQLDKVTLNNGLQTIGNNAFISNHILGINLPSSVDKLGEGVLAENSVWITQDEVSNYNYSQKTFTVDWQKLLLNHGINSNQFILHSAVAYTQDVVSPLSITLATKDATVKLANYDPIEFNKERTLFEPFEISSTNGKVILSQDIPIRFRNDMIFMDLGALTPNMTINQGDSLDFKNNIHAFDMHDGIVPYTITANGKPITSTSSLAPGTYHIVVTASDVTGDSVDDNIPETISKSITLIILPIKDTVTFDSNGGTDVPSQTVDQDITPTEPAPPTKLNSTFSGWYTDSSCTTPWNPADPIEKDTTLYAKWTPIKDTVKFISNGGTPVPAQTVNQGSTATEPTPPTKLNNTFSGWYIDPRCTTSWNPVDPIEKDTIVYAKWTPIKASITFNSNGGTPVPSQTVDQGSTPTEPTPPTKLNSTFSGWYTDPSCTTPWNPADPIEKDTTLYAKWTPIKDTVKFISNGGTPVPSQTVDQGSTPTEPTPPTKLNSTFSGWYTDPSCTTPWNPADSIEKDCVKLKKMVSMVLLM
ncbi:hypothetical protein AN639_08020 [Candidatus Epulonipiscium fishelsonii]|nr:hypothetical protein AN639_08020 [Epulopiscium sp. SCG-B05WGA-EpuloA1]